MKRRLKMIEAGGTSTISFKWFFYRLFVSGSEGEPKYDGFQAWVHGDIPDYNDPTKNVVDQKYPIINYPV